MSFVEKTRGESQENWPVWCRVALDKHKVHPVWLHSFLFSEIFDFGLQRVGAFIIPETCQFMDKVPALLRCRIPLTFLRRLDAPNFGPGDFSFLPINLKNDLQVSNADRSFLVSSTDWSTSPAAADSAPGWGAVNSEGSWANLEDVTTEKALWTGGNSSRTAKRRMPRGRSPQERRTSKSNAWGTR